MTGRASRMDRGKHNGLSMSEVPEDYLTWAMEQASGPLQRLCVEEIVRRGKQSPGILTVYEVDQPPVKQVKEAGSNTRPCKKCGGVAKRRIPKDTPGRRRKKYVYDYYYHCGTCGRQYMPPEAKVAQTGVAAPEATTTTQTTHWQFTDPLGRSHDIPAWINRESVQRAMSNKEAAPFCVSWSRSEERESRSVEESNSCT